LQLNLSFKEIFKTSIFEDGNRRVGPETAAPHEHVALPTSNLPKHTVKG